MNPRPRSFARRRCALRRPACRLTELRQAAHRAGREIRRGGDRACAPPCRRGRPTPTARRAGVARRKDAGAKRSAEKGRTCGVARAGASGDGVRRPPRTRRVAPRLSRRRRGARRLRRPAPSGARGAGGGRDAARLRRRHPLLGRRRRQHRPRRDHQRGSRVAGSHRHAGLVLPRDLRRRQQRRLRRESSTAGPATAPVRSSTSSPASAPARSPRPSPFSARAGTTN